MTSPPNRLLLAAPPWIVGADMESDIVQAAVCEAGQFGVVIEFDSSAARTLDAFFGMMSGRLNLPNYFGRNWAALKDCLTDLEWLGAPSYLFVYKDANQLFSDELAERPAFLQTMTQVAGEWAAPVDLGEWWDRPATPFHVVLDLRSNEWSPERLPYL